MKRFLNNTPTHRNLMSPKKSPLTVPLDLEISSSIAFLLSLDDIINNRSLELSQLGF